MEFEQLTAELINFEVVKGDITLKLTLSLTSRRLYEIVGPLRNFECFTFMDECVRAEYLNLFEYALSNGARGCVRLSALSIAVGDDKIQFVRRISSFLKWPNIPSKDLERMFLYCAGGKFNRREYFDLFGPAQGQIYYQFACQAAAKHGHTALAKELLSKAEISNEDYHLAYFCAQSGILGACLEFCDDPHRPTAFELSAIFHGACYGGHIELAKWAVENGFVLASIKSSHDLGHRLPSISVQTLEYLYSLSPSAVATEMESFIWALVRSSHPSMEQVRWLQSHGAMFHSEHLSDLVKFEFCRRPESASKEIVCERFECIQYLATLPDISFASIDPAYIGDSCRFSSLPQFKWILEQSNFALPKGKILSAYLRFNIVADLVYVSFLISLDETVLNHMYLMDDIFGMGNNLELMEFFETRFSYFSKRKAQCPLALETLVNRYFPLSANDLFPVLDSKPKYRMHNLIKVFDWFLSRRLISVQKAKRSLNQVKHPYLLEALGLLFQSFE